MIYLPVAILIVIVLLAILSVPAFRLKQKLYKKTGKYPVGHYMGLGMAVGLLGGMFLGILTDNVALGTAAGLPVAIAVGTGLEQKYKKKLRPLTKQEKVMQKRLMLTLLVIGVISFLIFLYVIKAPDLPNNLRDYGTDQPRVLHRFP